MQMNKTNMAIVVIGFDGYDDLWDDFFALFRKYWSDCPYKVYLVNNEKRSQYEGVTVINAGSDAEWSRKVQFALKEVQEDYLCLMLEDFYIGSKVNTGRVKQTLKLMSEDAIKYYKLKTFSAIKTAKYKNYDYLHVIPENLEYGVSLQPGIWKKEFLQEKIGTKNYNAWKFECDRIAEERLGRSIAMQGCVYDDRNILEIQHGVVQGKYLPKTLKYFENLGYALNQQRRGAMKGKRYFVYLCKKNANKYLPKSLKKGLKRVLNVFGMNFVTDKNA